MELIPVLDLKGGVVVRARMGERRNYQPIQTPLSPSSAAADVLRGLLALHPFQRFYVADLDGIEGLGGNTATLQNLSSQFGVTLWVDNGAADLPAARHGLDAGFWPVLGSETQHDTALMDTLANDPRIALSLDFRGNAFLGPARLLEDPALWPHRVIVMSLDRVGSNRGPDTGRLAAIKAAAGDARRVYAAGGVRHAADLAELAGIGLAGALISSCLHDGRVTARDIVTLA